MATTYDQIWQTFLNNCKASDLDIPSTPEKIYEAIRNAVMHTNNRLRTEIEADDITEQVNVELDNDELLILAHYIRYFFLLNQKTYFEQLWQPFASDISLKNFSAQLKSLDGAVDKEQHTIDMLIRNMSEDYL